MAYLGDTECKKSFEQKMPILNQKLNKNSGRGTTPCPDSFSAGRGHLLSTLNPMRGGNYCHKYGCLFVCLSDARMSRKPLGPSSANVSCTLTLAVFQSFSVAVAMLFTSGFVDVVMFSHNWPSGTSSIFLSSDLNNRSLRTGGNV